MEVSECVYVKECVSVQAHEYTCVQRHECIYVSVGGSTEARASELLSAAFLFSFWSSLEGTIPSFVSALCPVSFSFLFFVFNKKERKETSKPHEGRFSTQGRIVILACDWVCHW